ncbi:MAG: type IV secretory system conjugative DNA transfer family protein [Bacilli bacterium]|nr:type IV secretory system conjugative DNA transfer family protein [Bacilli bacterium]
MKFRVRPKDFVIFVTFSIFLLFLCSWLIGNLFSVINEEGFTFNPFSGLFGPHFLITLIVFFGIEVAIFTSVESKIFESDSGFGLTFGEKESKGYSRWLKEKEMKKGFKMVEVGVQDPDAPAAGAVLINDGKKMWVDNSENHTLVIGITGSGKTSAVIDPLIYSLMKHKESMIMTDPKGELYKRHTNHLKARGYDIIVLNFREPSQGNSWNPLSLPYKLYKEGNVDKAIELVDDIGKNIVKDKDAQDPFWQDSAGDYFSGCALGLMQDAKEEECNISSINVMTTVGEDKLGAGSTYIKEYFNMKGEDSSAYVFASNTINSPTETKGGILSTFRQKIRVFASRENLSEMLSYSDFDMASIGKKPTAVFIIIHDEKTTYHALATIFIKQAYETLIDVAQANGGPLPVRTNFLLDEFANMPALKDVTTMVTAARSRQIRFTFIIQNFAQLNDVYGKDDAETIRSNCGNLIYLLTTELSALEEISKLCGEVKSKKDEKSESHPLITVADLQKLQMNEVIVLRSRMHPFKTKFKQAFNINWGDEKYDEAEFFTREKKPIQVFQIKEFVNLRMKSKINNKMGGKGMMGGSPFGPGMGGGMPLGMLGAMGGGMPNGMPAGMPAGMQGGMPSRPQSSGPSSFEDMMRGDGMPSSRPEQPRPQGINIEELMKKIDAKIAELEAEEEAEKKANEENKLNPLNTEGAKDLPSIPKDDIETPDDKKLPASNIASFNEILSSAKATEPKVDNHEPKPMFTNPLDTETKAPSFPSEPIINKPLTGIIDPTKQMTYDSMVKSEPITVKPVEQTKPVEPKVEPKENPYKYVSDDEFFDDFFDEE